jgi:glycosyltransferase involved in cell wall biosynthesis
MGIKLLQSCPGILLQTFSPLGWWDIYARKQIRAAVAGFRPQVVQAHLARGAYVAGKICTGLRIPLAVKTHNYVDLKYYRQVDCFIATTVDQQNYLVRRGIDRDKIEVIPNFSSLPAADNVSAARNNAELAIISYGRLVRKKGFHVLLKALRAFIDSGRNATLRIGGDGPERPALMKLCGELGLEKQVRFCGWIDDIAAFARNADIFVLPSLDEPFGIAILEMMACGMPIIATRTRGPLEILHTDMAYLVDPDDPGAIMKALCLALDQRVVCRQKAEKSLQVYRESYAGSVVIPRIIRLYCKLARASSD